MELDACDVKKNFEFFTNAVDEVILYPGKISGVIFLK
jgi:hypothetical protein